jgi:CIC family chloride channel protein
MAETFMRLRRGLAWCLDRLRFSESASMMVLAVLVGLVCGLGSVGFHKLVGQTGRVVEWLAALGTHHPVLAVLCTVLAPALGGLLAGSIVSLLARHDTSHGTASVMEAVALRGGRLPARPFLAKVLGAGVLIGSGGSAGPEDPNVQLGAVVG